MKGFSLPEMLVVIIILAVPAVIAVPIAFNAMEKSRLARVKADSRIFRDAAESYYADMSFYPPEVNRGSDPGLTRDLPFNPDGQSLNIDASGCPGNWQEVVNGSWDGPYVEPWVASTPWQGKYDYNHWYLGTTVDEVSLRPGIYLGVQPDYVNQTRTQVPSAGEQKYIDEGWDKDEQVHGAVYFKLRAL